MSAAQPPMRPDSVPTGHPEIDQALAELAAVAQAPPAEQIPAITDVHRVLRSTLDTIEDA